MVLKLLPQSFFGRNVLMIATLLLLSHLVSYATVKHFVVEPHERTVMFLAAGQINQQRAQYKLPKFFQHGLRKNTLLDVFKVTPRNMPKGLRDSIFHLGYTQQGISYLGEKTEVRVETSDRIYLWINEPRNAKYWFRLPIGDYDINTPLRLILFFAPLILLSMAGAALLVAQLMRPLKRLAFAAREVANAS